LWLRTDIIDTHRGRSAAAITRRQLPMNKRLGEWLLVLSLVLPVGAACAAEAPAKEVLALEQAFNEAYAANDLPKYFGYYAEDLVALFPEGRTTLAAYREEWSKFIKDGNRLTSVKTSDMVIRPSPAGDEVTASYRIAVRTRFVDGKFTDELFDESDVWLKRTGKWQVAHVHYSAAPPPKKP
jgi:ketosteroid isomerase-like protein